MRPADLRKFGRRLGFEMTPGKASNLLLSGRLECMMLADLCDRYMTGELLLRVDLPMRRERVDATPVIDMIDMSRKYKGDDAATRVPFVRTEKRVKDGWAVEGGRTIVNRRGRRFELCRELRALDPVYLWDERKVLWTDGTLK